MCEKYTSLVIKRILLVLDNTRPHTAAQPQAALESDTHISCHLKYHFDDGGYENDAEVKTALSTWSVLMKRVFKV